jgi:predicted RNA-binding Zn-ribbon protein involved in translation (DUF1610 family)
VVKLEWGTKRTCQSCTARFYDLRRSPILCPKCGETFEIQTAGRRTRSRTSPIDDEKLITLPLGDDLLGADIDLPADLDADLDDDTLIEDTSDLGEDLDDMSDVIDTVDESEEH